ncbi:hypothetical protein F3Y22_tig00110930pilonHSYRG00091 [Hibiscus syriacus]|uniref:Uncharacterized protein n=1 Tax=Hibiscus syriacus TaxID=106335 RepID=A0A6A2ZE77_HIBSY|nr:hypothetical protein F3Y22_tig00110930pilonHSYRG00091 [Hibiscus syriacus]
MGEETNDAMNLDLNLGPTPETGSGSVSDEGLDWDLVDNQFNRIREAVRRRRWRWQQVQFPAATQNLSVELINLWGIQTMRVWHRQVRVVLLWKKSDDVPKPVRIPMDSWKMMFQKARMIEKGVRNDGNFFDYVNSDAKECPVCKEEVTVKTLTPIYGRGKIDLEPEDNSGQDRIADSVLSRIMTSRRLRGEQTTVASLDDVDLRPSSTNGTDVCHPEFILVPSKTITINYVELQDEQPLPVDDRDSVSSIAAVINSESQMDTAAEIDSVVSLSASSSRRRNDNFRVSDVDRSDPRVHRRRRLN